MRAPEHDPDVAIARIADAQRGIITHVQLINCGLDRYAIKRRREQGRLRLLFRGVYVVGHAVLADLALETAAVLVCAPHRAVDEAIALELVDRPGLLAVIERYPRQRGAAILRELADPQRASQITQREAEERMLVLLRRAAGYVVLRFTRRQVMFEPEFVLFRLGQALSSAGLRVPA
jgi:hypothetical protein